MALLNWFNVRDVMAVGEALADQLAPQASGRARHEQQAPRAASSKVTQEFLRQAQNKVGPLRLNFYKRAKLANSFKWRLRENGVEEKVADEATKALVLHLFMGRADVGAEPAASASAPVEPSEAAPKPQQLLSEGNRHFAQGAFAEALACYQELVALKPRHADGLNNLGAVLCKLGRYLEAEPYFHRALQLRPDNAEAHNNLGSVQRWNGQFREAEASLRRALKLKPNYLDARSLLGLTLVQQGRLREARAQLEKVLKAAPRHTEALLALAQVASSEGRFEDAEKLFKRVIEIEPGKPGAWAGLAACAA